MRPAGFNHFDANSGASPNFQDITSRLEALERNTNGGSSRGGGGGGGFQHQSSSARGGGPQYGASPLMMSNPQLQSAVPPYPNQQPVSWSDQQMMEARGGRQQQQQQQQQIDEHVPLSATRTRGGKNAAAAATGKNNKNNTNNNTKAANAQSQKSYLSSSQFSSSAVDSQNGSVGANITNSSSSSATTLIAALQTENAELRGENAGLRRQLDDSKRREDALRQALIDLATAQKGGGSGSVTNPVKLEVKSEFDVDSIARDDDALPKPGQRSGGGAGGPSLTSALPQRRGRLGVGADDGDNSRSASLHSNKLNGGNNNARTASSSSTASSTAHQYTTFPQEGNTTILSPPPKIAAAMRQAAEASSNNNDNGSGLHMKLNFDNNTASTQIASGLTPLHAGGAQGSRYGAFPAPNNTTTTNQQNVPPPQQQYASQKNINVSRAGQQQQQHQSTFTRHGDPSATPSARNNNNNNNVNNHESPSFWAAHHQHVTERDFDVVASAVVGAEIQNQQHRIQQSINERRNMNNNNNNHISSSLGGPLSAPNNGNAGASRGASPVPHHPLRGAAVERRFTFSGFNPQDKNLLSSMIDRIGQHAFIVECGADEAPPRHVTHVVVPDRPQSVKALCALVSGRWIVTPAYLQESMRLGFWANEENVEGSLRCPDFPLKGEKVLLQVPGGPIREALRTAVEYGEGQVVEDDSSSNRYGGASRQRNKYVIVSTGTDIVNLCKQSMM